MIGYSDFTVFEIELKALRYAYSAKGYRFRCLLYCVLPLPCVNKLDGILRGYVQRIFHL